MKWTMRTVLGHRSHELTPQTNRKAQSLVEMPSDEDADDDVVRWDFLIDEDQNCTDRIRNLKSRLRREFHPSDVELTDPLRQYLLNLCRCHPFTNHIYGELQTPPMAHTLAA